MLLYTPFFSVSITIQFEPSLLYVRALIQVRVERALFPHVTILDYYMVCLGVALPHADDADGDDDEDVTALLIEMYTE